jgi:hypothetical protein
VRAQLTPTRLEAIQRRLADSLEARGGDPLRVAVWQLEAGAGGDAALFAAAARQALAAADAALAERLSRAAVDAGGGFDARLTLARALAGAGRGREAQRLFADLGAAARGDRERAAVALASARNLFWALDRAAEADAVLRDAEERVSDRVLRDELTAQRVRLVAAQGRPPDALAAARAVLEDESVSERARTTAALGAVEALFSSGRSDEAVALAERSLPAARQLREELPHAEPVLLGMRALALRLAGRLIEATASSESAYAQLLPRRSAAATTVEANSPGPDLAGERPGPHRAALLPRERRAPARRRRRGDAGLRPRRSRPGGGTGRRRRRRARGGHGDGADAAGAQGLRGRARAGARLERRGGR